MGLIWLDNVNCRGSENRLIDCPANPLGVHDCDPSNDASFDAGVFCSVDNCTEGAVRLQGGNASQGRVEYCKNNVWGSVCSVLGGSWDDENARVICRQLGLPTSGMYCFSNIPYLNVRRISPVSTNRLLARGRSLAYKCRSLVRLIPC